MAPARNLTLSLLLLATGPIAIVTGLACGGGKPPETPADESSSNADGGDTTATNVGAGICGTTNGCVAVYKHHVRDRDDDGDRDHDDDMAHR